MVISSRFAVCCYNLRLLKEINTFHVKSV